MILTAPSTDIWFRPAVDARTMRQRASTITAEERKAATGKDHTHGGARDIIVCPDHPAAAIRKEWKTFCSVCDLPLDKGEEAIKPPVLEATDPRGMDILSTNSKRADPSPSRRPVDELLDKLSIPPAQVPIEPAWLLDAPPPLDVYTDVAHGRAAP